MKLFTALFFLLLVCAGCHRKSSLPPAAEWRASLHRVTVADGISQPEAEIICECYFAKNDGVGVFQGVHDGGDRWIVDAAFGNAMTQVQGFYIEKRSGKVVSPIGPSYDNPLDIFP